MSGNSKVKVLELTNDEAVVLHYFLHRYTEEGELRIEDQAERRVLWDLCCMLERQLVEPFDENYLEILARARERVRDDGDGADDDDDEVCGTR